MTNPFSMVQDFQMFVENLENGNHKERIMGQAQAVLRMIIRNLLVDQGVMDEKNASARSMAIAIECPDFNGIALPPDVRAAVGALYYEVAFVFLGSKFNSFNQEEAFKYITIAGQMDPQNIEYLKLACTILSFLLTKDDLANRDYYERTAYQAFGCYERAGQQLTNIMHFLYAGLIIRVEGNQEVFMKQMELGFSKMEEDSADYEMMEAIKAYQTACRVTQNPVYAKTALARMQEYPFEERTSEEYIKIQTILLRMLGRFKEAYEIYHDLYQKAQKEGKEQNFKYYDELIDLSQRTQDMGSATIWKQKKEQLYTLKAKGICFFLATLFDQGFDSQAIGFAHKYANILSVLGINPNQLNKAQIYSMVGRDANGVPFAGNMVHFSEDFQYAIDNLWKKPNRFKAKKSIEKLKALADAGNADAHYFLGRCYLGSCFVPGMLRLPENEALGMEYFQQSIEKGSAFGMFATRRLGGFKPRCGSYVQPPFDSELDVWQAMYNYAISGNEFAMFLVGNAFYYHDVLDFFHMEPTDDVLYYNTVSAIFFFQKQYDKKFYLCGGNYEDAVTSGDYGIPVNEELARAIRKH